MVSLSKKTDVRNCEDLRTISFITDITKVMARTVLRELKIE